MAVGEKKSWMVREGGNVGKGVGREGMRVEGGGKEGGAGREEGRGVEVWEGRVCSRELVLGVLCSESEESTSASLELELLEMEVL